MSTHFLLDSHSSPLLTSEINDVRRTISSSSPLNGSFVVRVPDEVSLGPTPPLTLSDLITQKYSGLLAFYAGFTRIAFDDMIDATGVNSGASTGVSLGERCSISIVNGGGGLLESNPVALVGAAPSQAILTWEIAALALADTKTNVIERVYTEQDPGSTSTVNVSFNGGATFLTVSEGSPFIIPALDQGVSLVIRITNTALFKIFPTSWALIY